MTQDSPGDHSDAAATATLTLTTRILTTCLSSQLGALVLYRQLRLASKANSSWNRRAEEANKILTNNQRYTCSFMTFAATLTTTTTKNR